MECAQFLLDPFLADPQLGNLRLPVGFHLLELALQRFVLFGDGSEFLCHGFLFPLGFRGTLLQLLLDDRLLLLDFLQLNMEFFFGFGGVRGGLGGGGQLFADFTVLSKQFDVLVPNLGVHRLKFLELFLTCFGSFFLGLGFLLQGGCGLCSQLQFLLLDSQVRHLGPGVRQVRVQLSDLVFEPVLHVPLFDRERLDVVGKPFDLHLQVPNEVVPVLE